LLINTNDQIINYIQSPSPKFGQNEQFKQNSIRQNVKITKIFCTSLVVSF